MAKERDFLSDAPWAAMRTATNSRTPSSRLVPPLPCMFSQEDQLNSLDLDDGEDALEIDPELRYSFQRNFQFLQRVFSIDTIVKPLPPAMAYNVSRNLSFFTRIFTRFFDPEGIANVQKLLGLGQEEKARQFR
ncbi:hypothetical protein K2173_014519 [Erythroxylum novogranatense]|uniref:Uncharacterized protein n=1 Tax=Erythroxylum novogranatense TaxID=1862640 RepID=A0AAV8S5H3_9ROSI|nr:hypothetical protein K2173_014519 [Erythroxylum novogranatense]